MATRRGTTPAPAGKSEAQAAIEDRRRHNLLLFTGQYINNQAEAARRLGLQDVSYLSQLKRGHRPISEKTARRMESSAGLPIGWFDQDRTGKTADEGAVATPKTGALFMRVVDLVAAVMRDFDEEFSDDKVSAIVDFAYRDARNRGAPDETYVRRLVELASCK